jgi:diguanylate cyclase (GGDEF)-like protein
VSGAKQLEKGNLTARVGPPYGHGELGELAQTFDEMAASLPKNAVLLQYQATHDALTGLSNRNFFIDHLRAEILSAEGRNKSALLLMDLDRFKEINDTIGHDNGDLLIKSATDRLKAVVGSSGIIARLGGDEFAVFLTNGDRAAAVALARDIMKAFEKPFILDDLPITSEVSIGIALFPEHGDFLIRRAEVAMYLAKEEKTGYAVYAPEKDTYSPERLILLTDLRHAIEENELYLAYQPKIDIQGRAVNGVEALVRWQHPRLGLVPPDQFIGLAERTGLIKPLTLWVLNEALRQCHLWRQEGIALSVAVNLSARNLEPTLPEQISALLRSYDLPSEALQIEITEGSIMRDPVHAREILNHLSELGIKIAIDDFGTGYSSLAYLSKLPVDQIKIDRSFVMNLTADENAAVIVRSTIDLGHQLGLEVIAEGVENEEIINRLRALGCDCAQGYYISRPLKAPELTTWLANAT